MPAALPRAALGLDLICEGRTLNKRVVPFEVSHGWVLRAVHLEKVGGLRQRSLSLSTLLEVIISDASH